MEPGLAVQFISGLPREMLFSFYFTGDSPRREPQLKRSPFPPASPERRATRLPRVAKHCGQVAGRHVLRHNSTGLGGIQRAKKEVPAAS